MCGRAAQTVYASDVAAASFGIRNRPQAHVYTQSSTREYSDNLTHQANDNSDRGVVSARDNYNMSPGMDAAVMWMEDGELKMDRKVWGLVTKGGTVHHPLPADSKSRMGMHFSGLMYNARTDTLFDKPTFSRLANQKKSCVVALDGYFEWKSSPLAGGKGKKQPYFIYAKDGKNMTEGAVSESDSKHGYLLLAGLWTRVPTGLSDEPFLDTFTILTTEACKQIEWLHHRMPVCLWDMSLAKKWLSDPTPTVHQQIDAAAKSNSDGFAWYMVTTEMSSVKFRSIEAIKEKKPPKPVMAYFSKVTDTKSRPSRSPSKSSVPDTVAPVVSTPTKRAADPLIVASPTNTTPTKKKAKLSIPDDSGKKGLITSFFVKKS